MTGFRGNYLRVRGEYATDRISYSLSAELPPRARRIRPTRGGLNTITGTTSACAENTGNRFHVSVVAWNYLRVRGEYLMFGNAATLTNELPPRARRIP